VAVIAAADAKGGTAMTATSISTLSMDPPAVLICVNKRASLFGVLERDAEFSVNFLSVGQEELARLCSDATSREKRYLDPAFAHGDECHAPTVSGAVANLICKQVRTISYGSHVVIIGEVKAVQSGGSAPLLYSDGKYCQLAVAT
tara:strand:+ start:6801 stop:7235 length:435 start_codon:yes stop_codon:yes gene_type:complete